MRLTEAIRTDGYTGVDTSPQLRIEEAGYDGFYPVLAKEIGGKNFELWLQNSAYVSRNLTPVVIRTPKMFQILQDTKLGERLTNLYIAIMTRLPLTIDGIKSTVTLETVEHRVGAAGEMHEEFAKSNRERTTITKTYTEKLGKPINRFFDFIIRYGIMDPDTQTPLITTLPIREDSLKKGELYTADYYTGTMLYFEADVINKNIVEATLATNVAPKTAGEVTMKRDLSAGGELREYSIEFTSIAQSGEAIRAGAQVILDRMTIFKQNPDKDTPIAIHDDELSASLGNEFSFNTEPIEAVNINKDTENAFNS